MKFAKKLKKLVATVLSVAVSVGFFTYSCDVKIPVKAKTLAQLQQEQKAIQDKIASVNSNIAASKNNINKEKEYQAAISEKIELTEENILLITDKISELDRTIAGLEKDIENQEKDIEEGLALFKNRVRTMYMSGGNNYASVLAGSTDFYDLLTRMELVERVAEHDDKMIDDLNELLASLEKSKADVEEKRAEADAVRVELEEQKAELNSAYDQSTAHQQQLEKEYQEYLKNKKALDAEAEKAEEAIRAEIARLATMGGNFNGQFLWPVPGYTYISSGYGYRWGKLHKGIDIAGGSIAGKPIVAAASGKVIVASATCTHNYPKWSSCGCGSGYGNYVMIDHGNGYVTLYGHCKTLNVSAGQSVAMGQTIAYVGTTGYSTGYHCHFEIRKGGVPEDPMKYLK